MSGSGQDAPAGPPSDVMPVVAPENAGNRSMWIFAGVLAIAALLLFTTLDSRRRALLAPATAAPATVSSGMISAPPELTIPTRLNGDLIPRDGRPVFRPQRLASRDVQAPRRSALPAPLPSPPESRSQPEAPYTYPEPYVPETAFAQRRMEPSVVFDARTGRDRGPETFDAAQGRAGQSDRVHAGRLNNPSTTVPQGTVIPAVLETALDSTRPGAVRAITSRDVRGFDGSRTLIPRGSRLYGEYGAELTSGQNRTHIRWTRLVRPDGAMIALDSPASDPLGRAGLRGRVNSNFLERFGEALLQSTIDIGVGIAGRRAAGDAVILALPGSNPQVTGRGRDPVQRTLRVNHGTSVSVFVARDLDFTAVER